MKISLGRKIVFMLVIVSFLLIVTCIVVSAAVFRRLMEKEYLITADSMAGTVAVSVDGDRMKLITDKVMQIYYSADKKISNEQQDEAGFEEYKALFLDLMKDEDYIAMRDALRSIQDVSEVDCVYTVFIVPDEKNAVYIVDAAHEDIVTPGCFDKVEESCYEYLDDLTKGFPAFLTDTEEYGWVATACMPIYDSDGNIVCFAAVDLSMEDILSKVSTFLIALTGMLLVLTVVICIIAIIYVRKKIVKPINMLSEAAAQYAVNKFTGRHSEFGNLEIKTGDEIEVLHNSMVQMENDIDRYVNNLTQTKAQLSSARQQADDMQELAHMDSLTGIRNRLAYDNEITKLDAEIDNGLEEFGIAMIDLNYLKATNDSYGHEYGNRAIKMLSNLVCEIFAHSPVFRIGGDEFVVILRNADYENISSLEKKFNDQITEISEDDTLQPWERISAALGYAMFDPGGDRSAEDVFKRADRRMYDRKKKMKAMKK